MDESRVIVYSPQGDFVQELPPDLVFERIRTEELNGEHSISITTAVVLSKGQRLLTCDATETWREYVVQGEDAEHASGKRAIGTYYCIWSLQHDLIGTTCTAMPGTQTPTTASLALEALLSNTTRWQRGTVTQTSTGGASMWRKSAWEALGILTEVWGGEVGASIAVDGAGVISRSVDLWAHEGSEAVTRRFDYSRDLEGIKRNVSEDEVFARIIPLGKGEETASGGIGRKIDITSVNDGVEWLENQQAALAYRVPDGHGGWEYPTAYVENSDCETPATLKEWGLSVLPTWTTPKVSYTADVVQLAEAGMDVQGIALGDEVHVVDRSFGGDGIRIQGRVIRLVTDELQPSNVTVTLGNLAEGLQDVFSELSASLSRTRDVVQAINGGTMSTAEYLSRLIERINAETNATGGYTYITEGQGIRTYDVAVSDPLVGAEASAVTELKGGTIRIANSKTAQGAWEWKTLITSGHVAAELVTVANLTAGFVGSASSGNYWDLDNGVLQLASTTTIDGEAIATQDAVISEVDVEYAQSTSSSQAPVSGWSTTAPTWKSGKYVWQRTKTVNQAGTASYSTPTCIQGAKGTDGSPGSPGAQGVGVSAIVEQYYLSTSASTQTGGSWGTTQPAWASGKYIWTRSQVTWTNNTTTYTDPVLAQAINGANQAASDAEKVATNYLAFDANGLCVGDQTSGTLRRNILIGSSNIDVRNGTTILARFAAKLIELGRNATDAVIKFCGGSASISASTTGGVTVSSFEGDNTAIRGKSGTKTAHVVCVSSNTQPMITIAATDTSATQSASSMVVYNDHFSVNTSEFALNTGKLNLNTGVNAVSRCSAPTSWTQNFGVYAYRNQYGVVSVYCVPQVVAGGAIGTSDVGTLPVGWRPYQNQYQRVYCGGWCVLQVNTDGKIYFVRQEQTVADTLYVCMSFPAVNTDAV